MTQKNKRFWLIIFVIIIILFFSIGLKKIELLVIEEAKSGKIIWQQKTEPQMKFAIKYLHSVERTPVWEYFKVDKGEIYLTGTKYESYGAGLPFLNRHQYIVANDKFEIKEINQQLKNIPLRVSDYAKHLFIYNNKEYKLYEKTAAKNLVIIKLEKKSNLVLFSREVQKWLTN